MLTMISNGYYLAMRERNGRNSLRARASAKNTIQMLSMNKRDRSSSLTTSTAISQYRKKPTHALLHETNVHHASMPGAGSNNGWLQQLIVNPRSLYRTDICWLDLATVFTPFAHKPTAEQKKRAKWLNRHFKKHS